jgi:hypothetical protein
VIVVNRRLMERVHHFICTPRDPGALCDRDAPASDLAPMLDSADMMRSLEHGLQPRGFELEEAGKRNRRD